MKILIKGAGWYGCHIGLELLDAGHEVAVHELRSDIFLGASGNNPARLHSGFHYPRSSLTQESCMESQDKFLRSYGFLTNEIKSNIYAVADHGSLLDFGAYKKCIQKTAAWEEVSPTAYGLKNVEGAVAVQERHIVIDEVRKFFREALKESLFLNSDLLMSGPEDYYDWIIDCTFSQTAATPFGTIDRYEPCLTVLLHADTSQAITIMDGPFPSLYPWNEELGLCSLTSALYTPLSKICKSYSEAANLLDRTSKNKLKDRAHRMFRQMVYYYPKLNETGLIIDDNLRTSIRAMPSSAADARICKVVKTGNKTLVVLAGKIDAIFHAEGEIKRIISK